jgi:predicted transcriptional regulator
MEVEDEQHFADVVNAGLAAAERGEFVDHEEVGRRLKEILRPDSKRIPPP